MPKLTNLEKERMKDCAFNIDDKTQAIKYELFKEDSYKGYILEKAQSILNDIKVIINICKGE